MPNFTKLSNIQQHYVQICNTDFHAFRTTNIETTDISPFMLVRVVWLYLRRFSRNSQCRNTRNLCGHLVYRILSTSVKVQNTCNTSKYSRRQLSTRLSTAILTTCRPNVKHNPQQTLFVFCADHSATASVTDKQKIVSAAAFLEWSLTNASHGRRGVQSTSGCLHFLLSQDKNTGENM